MGIKESENAKDLGPERYRPKSGKKEKEKRKQKKS